MTDNYQIDKNSKLFQKFLNLKNNKAAESSQDRTSQADPAQSFKNPSKVVIQPSSSSGMVKSKNNEKAQLHVTIGDIEEAASMSFQEEDCATIRTNNKQSLIDHLEQPLPSVQEAELPFRPEFEMTMKEEYSSNRPLELPQQQKPKQRRNRDYDRNRSKNEGRNDRSFRMNQSIDQPPIKQIPIQPISRNDQGKREKQNLISLNEDEQTTVREENMFTLGTREGQYKKKYEKLHQKYQELKETIQKERKQKQQQLNDKQAEIQLIRQKYFELRSNQDSLTNDLKRLKDKLQSQNMIRTKFEEEVKELNFKIQEMDDMLDGKEGTLKKKSDEVAHWKTHCQQMRGEVKALNADIQRLQERCQFLESQNKMIKKDIQNKESLIEELRRNVNILIEENNIAKDQIYKLTIKSYHYEQENQIIKGDLMRRDREQPPQMTAIQENFMRSIETLSPKRREARQERYERPADRQEKPERGEREQPQGNNRRRQFARERAITSKVERQQRPAQRQERKMNVEQKKPEVNYQRNQRRTEPPIMKHNREVHARIQYLQEQLQRRKDQKAMTGKLRREKIQMQRELQELISKLNQ